MEFKPQEPRKSEFKTITPFPQKFPEFRVTMRDIQNDELYTIWDRVGFKPSPDRQTWAASSKATEEVVKLSIDGWEGLFLNGVAVPCTDENKIALLKMTMDDPMDPKSKATVWSLIQREYQTQEVADRKN